VSVVIDFEGQTLDGTVAGSVPYVAFDAQGVSPAYQVTARPAASNKTRLGPNPVYNFNNDIRLSADGVDWEDWGDDLVLESALPAVFYIQFRRSLNGQMVDLTDQLGLMGNNIIDLEGDAFGSGLTLTLGSGAAIQVNPAAGAGTTVSAGSGAAIAEGAPQYATGAGLTASSGSGAAAQKQPATGAGTTASAGGGASTALNPPQEALNAVLTAMFDGQLVRIVARDRGNGTYYEATFFWDDGDEAYGLSVTRYASGSPTTMVFNHSPTHYLRVRYQISGTTHTIQGNTSESGGTWVNIVDSFQDTVINSSGLWFADPADRQTEFVNLG
jgi:hypothetical protein